MKRYKYQMMDSIKLLLHKKKLYQVIFKLSYEFFVFSINSKIKLL